MSQFIGLFTVLSEDPLKLEEVSAPEYRRAEDEGLNPGVCAFPVAASAWPPVSFYGVFDCPRRGFPLGIYPLSITRRVSAGDRLILQFP